MKFGRSLNSPGNDHVRGQQAIEALLQLRHVYTGVRLEMGHLPQGVHAGISAARAMQHNRMIAYNSQRLLQHLLNSAMAGLHLPTVILCPVILNGKFNGSHFDIDPLR